MAIGLSSVTTDGLGLDNPRTSEDAQEKEKAIVIITWKDIISCSGWEKTDDVDCPTFKTVGWFVSDDGDTIKIASTLDYADAFGDAKDEAKPVPYGITAFPKGCVESMDYLCQ